MNDLNDDPDLNNHMNGFSNFVDKYRKAFQENKIQKSVIESLKNEISQLIKQSDKLKSNKNESNPQLVKIYADLKEKYCQMEIENRKILEEKNNSCKKLLEEKEELELYYKTRLKEMETKESELYMDLQLCQASSAVEFDEKQNTYQSIINDLNQKIKNQTETCNLLRQEIFTCKTNFIQEANEIKAENKDLKSKLSHAENQMNILQEVLMEERKKKQGMENEHSFSMSRRTPIKNTQNSLQTTNINKYSPLTVLDTSINKIQPINRIPPLRQLTPTTSLHQQIRKRRKLCNPDDYEDFEY